MTPLSTGTVEFLEQDHAKSQIDLQSNAARGTGVYGAILKSPIPVTNVSVWVRDRSRTWSSARFGFFNGAHSTRLDIALYPAPAPTPRGGTGGGGGGGSRGSSPSGSSGGGGTKQPVTTAVEVDELIGRKVIAGEWEQPEGMGVRALYQTASAALTSHRSPTLDEWLHAWLEQLEQYGIRLVNPDDDDRGPPSPTAKPIDDILWRAKVGAMVP
jgi:hypothetical protein